MKPTLRERWRWWRWMLTRDYSYLGTSWLGKTRQERNAGIIYFTPLRIRFSVAAIVVIGGYLLGPISTSTGWSGSVDSRIAAIPAAFNSRANISDAALPLSLRGEHAMPTLLIATRPTLIGTGNINGNSIRETSSTPRPTTISHPAISARRVLRSYTSWSGLGFPFVTYIRPQFKPSRALVGAALAVFAAHLAVMVWLLFRALL